MVMCSDFSLKALIREWDESVLGQNPVVVWGSEDYGGKCDETPGKFVGVTQVFSAMAAFAALNSQTGTMICWRVNYFGGKCDETPGKFFGVMQGFSRTLPSWTQSVLCSIGSVALVAKRSPLAPMLLRSLR